MRNSITNKDAMYMMFVERMNELADDPGRHNWWKLSDKKKVELKEFADKLDWFKMTEEEKVRVGKFADNFNWLNEEE